MRRRPPRSTRTDTLFPYTTLFRSDLDGRIPGGEVGYVFVAEVLGDDRHDLVLPLAVAEGLELGFQVDLALAGDVRGARYLGDAVDAGAGLALAGLLGARSVERRGGEESVNPWRTGWVPLH